MRQYELYITLIFILHSVITVSSDTGNVPMSQNTEMSEDKKEPPLLIEYCPYFTSDNISLAFEGEWLIEFFAPWCPACQSFVPIWEQVASYFNQPHKATKVAKVDVTLEPLISSHFMVTALPSIFHIYNGEVRLYQSSKRSFTALTQYINEKEWSEIPEVPFYFRPYSPIMSIFAYIIYFSMITQEYVMRTINGDPLYMAYIAGGFFLSCLCFGSILGLVIYFCCGVSQYQQYVPKKLREATSKQQPTNPQKDKLD